MDRVEFIQKMMTFCKCDIDEAIVIAYDNALSVPYAVDWNSFYVDTIKKLEKRSLPAPKWFLERIRAYKERDLKTTQYDGYKLLVKFKDGVQYDFVITPFGNTLEDLTKKCFNSNKVLQAIMYPPDVVFIGNGIYSQDAVGEVIYQA